MDKKLIIAIILVIVLTSAVFIFLTREKKEEPNPPEETATMILFYGEGCPHCAKVEEFINQNKVKEKISFEMKEIYYNSQNNALFRKKAAACGLPPAGLGVPLLWYDSNKCLVGDVDIINFFNQKINEGGNN
jgi:glutaredoxin